MGWLDVGMVEQGWGRAVGSCQLPVPSCPSEPSMGPPVPSILLCRALGTGEVMMAVPHESTRDMGNGHLAPCRASPSATCNSVLSPWYWGAVSALVRDNGTLFPLQRQQLRLFDHLPSLMAPDLAPDGTFLALAVPWHMVAACQRAGP